MNGGLTDIQVTALPVLENILLHIACSLPVLSPTPNLGKGLGVYLVQPPTLLESVLVSFSVSVIKH